MYYLISIISVYIIFELVNCYVFEDIFYKKTKKNKRKFLLKSLIFSLLFSVFCFKFQTFFSLDYDFYNYFIGSLLFIFIVKRFSSGEDSESLIGYEGEVLFDVPPLINEYNYGGIVLRNKKGITLKAYAESDCSQILKKGQSITVINENPLIVKALS